MQFYNFSVLAQGIELPSQSTFIESLPLAPLLIAFFIAISGFILYFLKKRNNSVKSNQEINNNQEQNGNEKINEENTPSQSIEKSLFLQNSQTDKEGAAASKIAFTNSKAQNLFNPEKKPFYKTYQFLGVIFLILFITIPTLIYFGVKRQQNTSIRADGCGRNCGAAADNTECWSWAGDGCGWSGDPYSGSCGCTRNTPNPTPIPTNSPNERCCSGSKDCPDGQQCVSGNSSCEANGQGVCRTRPGNAVGCCSGEQDCAPWEDCVEGNGACSSNKSCRSHAGCTRNSDCAPGSTCVGGTCSGGAGNLECYADKSGVRVRNTTGADVTCNGTYSVCTSQRSTEAECSANDGCQGPSNNVSNLSVPNNQTVTVGSISPSCAAWQSDIALNCGGMSCSNANNGCEWGANCGLQPTLTPTVPVSTPIPTVPVPTATTAPSGQCRDVRVYDSSGNRITDFRNIRAGQTVRFTTAGTSAGFNKARFRINNGAWLPSSEGTSQVTSRGEFYIDYPVPTGTTSIKVETMVYHSSLGWK